MNSKWASFNEMVKVSLQMTSTADPLDSFVGKGQVPEGLQVAAELIYSTLCM